MDEKPKRVSLLKDIEERLNKWLDSLTSSNHKTLLVVSISVSVLLIGLVSLVEILDLPDYVAFSVGAIAGAIVSLIVYYFVEYKKRMLTLYTEKVTHKVRVRHVLTGWAVLVPLLIFSSMAPFFPQGIGGVIIILAFFATMIIVRRSDDEFYYYNNGLIDPREIENEDEEEDS